MKRGDLLTIALQGDYGKPRPGVVVQGDGATSSNTVLVCPLTSEFAPENPHRIRLLAGVGTGLHQDSEIMVERVGPILRTKCGPVFGVIPDDDMMLLNEALSFVLGLGD